MNKIFKVKRNALGQSVVTSELAKSKGKIASVATILLSSILGASAANAETVSLQGTATGANAVAIGSNTYATSVDGVANGQGAVATGQNFSREDFNARVQEIAGLNDAKKAAQSDLNNLNNDKVSNVNLQQELNKQIADAQQKIIIAGNKVAQRDNLLDQKAQKESLTDGLNQAVSVAQSAYDTILTQGKNLYINFTDVLQTLDWNKLNQDGGRISLASDLKTKIETDFTDFAEKYTVDQYANLVDGYINKQAGYQGSLDSIIRSLETLTSPTVMGENKYYYHTIIYEGSAYTTLDKDFKRVSQEMLKYNDYLNLSNNIINNEILERSRSDISDNIDLQYSSLGFSPESYSNQGSNYNLYTFNYRKSIDNEEKKKVFNSYILASISKNKLISNNVGNYIREINTENGFSTKSKRGYNILNDQWLVFNLKTKSNSYVAPVVNDANRKYIDLLVSKFNTNTSTLTKNEISYFTTYYNNLKNWYNNIDWSDTNSAYDLASYQAQMDRTIALAEKIKSYNDIYIEILNEKQKATPDQTFIDRKTAELLNQYNVLVSEKAIENNLLDNYRLQFTNKANEYLNYGKIEADNLLNRASNELTLYDKDDKIVVDVTEAAKKLQDELNKAKAAADQNQATIDGIQKQINNLALTPEEIAADQTKKELEQKLQDAKNKQNEIQTSIDEKSKELENLTKQIENSSLRNLGLRSHAIGSNAFASGNDSIAIGTNATVMSDDGISIGHDSKVTGEKSIAIGTGNTVTGEKSIAVGTGHTVKGNRSGAFGDPNTVNSNDSYAFGNDNTLNAGSDNTFVLGNNVVTDVANSVALGANTTLKAAVSTSSILINGTTHNFAGTNAVGTVSVGNAGNERTITNVAAGRISESSTDAINGSQLYSVVDELSRLTNSAVDVADIADVIDSNSYWTLNTSNNGGGTQSGDGMASVSNQGTVTFDAGTNIALTQSTDNGNQIVEIKTVENPEFDSVTINNAPTQDNHAATKKYVDDSRTEITSGSSGKLTVESQTDSLTGKTTYTLDAKTSEVKGSNNITVQETAGDNGQSVYTASLNENVDLGENGSLTVGGVSVSGSNIDLGGNKIQNIADGEAETDAVTLKQLNASKSIIEGGKNVTVNKQVDSQTGATTYTINADAPKVNLTGGDNVKVDTQTDNVTGAVTYKLSADKTTVSSGTGIAVSTSTSLGDNGSIVTNYEISLTDDLKSQIAKEESVSTKGTNLVVSQDETNDSGGKNFVVDLAKDINLTQDGSLTIGGVEISSTNINAGGNKIENLADGVKETDAATVKQVNEAKSTIKGGDKVTVLTDKDATGGTVYTINSATSEVKGSDNITVQETSGNNGQSVYTATLSKDVDLTTDGSLTVGNVNISNSNVDLGGNTVQNIADGVKETDAATVKQVNAAKSTVEAGDKATVETKTNTDGSKTYVVNALTSNVTGGTNVKVNETKGDKNQSVFGVSVEGDLQKISSVSNGTTTITLKDKEMDVNGAKITNVATPTASTDAANKAYVDGSRTTVSSQNGTVKVSSSVDNATGSTNYDLAVDVAVQAGSDYIKAGNGEVDLSDKSKSAIDKVEQGLNTKTDDGLVQNHKLGETLTISGDDNNISTETKNGKVKVKLSDNVKVKSVTTGKVSISEKGVNAGGMKVTNVEAGEVSATSTDAVNGAQLHATNVQVLNNSQAIQNNARNIQNLDGRVSNVERKVDKVQQETRKGLAVAGAMAMLPQPTFSGKSMVGVATNNYRDQQALAVGYSRLSDNGKHIIKISGATNVSGSKEAMFGASYGYQW